MAKRIYVVYRMNEDISHRYIARKWIECLRENGYDVAALDYYKFKPGKELDAPVIVIPGSDLIDLPNLKSPRIIAADPIETNVRVLPVLEALQKADYIIVHSHWSRYVLKLLEIGVDIFVVPHWVDKLFDRPRREPRHRYIRFILSEKAKKDYVLFLYNLWHSGTRKGAPEVLSTFLTLKHRFPNIALVLKRKSIIDYYVPSLYTIFAFEFAEEIGVDDMIDLYDNVDATIVPSRSGGFELVAIESIYRGTVTFAPVCGCFEEFQDLITVPLACSYGSLPSDNAFFGFECGMGWRVDDYDFLFKLTQFIENPERYRKIAIRNMEEARKRFSWSVGCAKLVETIEELCFK